MQAVRENVCCMQYMITKRTQVYNYTNANRKDSWGKFWLHPLSFSFITYFHSMFGKWRNPPCQSLFDKHPCSPVTRHDFRTWLRCTSNFSKPFQIQFLTFNKVFHSHNSTLWRCFYRYDWAIYPVTSLLCLQNNETNKIVWEKRCCDSLCSL